MQEKFLSMVKIKDPDNTVPGYLINRMAGIVDDGWFSESGHFIDCNVLVCNYAVTGSTFLVPPVSPIDFYFRFAREQTKSVSESPEGEAFKFTGLLAEYEGKWYAKHYADSQLDAVKHSVRIHSQGAVSDLGLVEHVPINPLNFK